MDVIVTLEPKVVVLSILSSRYLGWFPISCFIFDIVTEKMDEILNHIVIQEGQYSPKLLTSISCFRLIQSNLKTVKTACQCIFCLLRLICVSRLFTF